MRNKVPGRGTTSMGTVEAPDRTGLELDEHTPLIPNINGPRSLIISETYLVKAYIVLEVEWFESHWSHPATSDPMDRVYPSVNYLSCFYNS